VRSPDARFGGGVLAPAGAWTVACSPRDARLIIGRTGAPGAVTVALPRGVELLKSQTRRETGKTVISFQSRSDWGMIATEIQVTEQPIPLVHWTVDTEWSKPHALMPNSPECSYLNSPSR